MSARPHLGFRPNFLPSVRATDGRPLRVAALRIDSGYNRGVCRGAGMLRIGGPGGTAPQLVREVLAKVPQGEAQ